MCLMDAKWTNVIIIILQYLMTIMIYKQDYG